MTQPQREALFDLLTLSLYADNHISLTEEALIESAFIAEGWQSDYPQSLFIEKSFARARGIAEADEEARLAYLAGRAAFFTDATSQAEALGVVTNLLTRDGLTPEENRFLVDLQRVMPALG
jgi:hypothetical protein